MTPLPILVSPSFGPTLMARGASPPRALFWARGGEAPKLPRAIRVGPNEGGTNKKNKQFVVLPPG